MRDGLPLAYVPPPVLSDDHSPHYQQPPNSRQQTPGQIQGGYGQYQSYGGYTQSQGASGYPQQMQGVQQPHGYAQNQGPHGQSQGFQHQVPTPQPGQTFAQVQAQRSLAARKQAAVSPLAIQQQVQGFGAGIDQLEEEIRVLVRFFVKIIFRFLMIFY